MRYIMGVIALILIGAFNLKAQSDIEQQIQVKLDSLTTKIQELQQVVDSLQFRQQEQELAQLRQQALQSAPTVSQKPLQRKSFRQGALNLQKLNPEISLTGDALTVYSSNDDALEPENGMHFRVVGLHFQSSLDPFSLSKVTISFSPEEGVDVEEAYITWTNPLPRTSITLGRFRQQLGIINRWHVHALDQSFFPLALRTFFGEEGLAQTGISFHTLLPSLTASANEVTLQIAMNENPELWGTGKGLPNALLHFKNYYDLTDNTYLEIGFTGLVGTNDTLGFQLNTSRGTTRVWGLDITLSWSPAQYRLYRQLDWRTEFFRIEQYPLHRPGYTGWGGFSYLNYRVNRRWYTGIRLDYQAPETPAAPFAKTLQVIPYATVWQSEFVYLRFQYILQYLPDTGTKNSQFLIQVDWAFGPHKHEKY